MKQWVRAGWQGAGNETLFLFLHSRCCDEISRIHLERMRELRDGIEGDIHDFSLDPLKVLEGKADALRRPLLSKTELPSVPAKVFREPVAQREALLLERPCSGAGHRRADLHLKPIGL